MIGESREREWKDERWLGIDKNPIFWYNGLMSFRAVQNGIHKHRVILFALTAAALLLLMWLLARSGIDLGASLLRAPECAGNREFIQTCRQGATRQYDAREKCMRVVCLEGGEIPKWKDFLPSCRGRYGERWAIIITDPAVIAKDGPCRRGGVKEEETYEVSDKGSGEGNAIAPSTKPAPVTGTSPSGSDEGTSSSQTTTTTESSPAHGPSNAPKQSKPCKGKKC